MEKEFSAKVLKPGDPGFQYDKPMDFSSNIKSAVEDSWDAEGEKDSHDGDYFDDDFDWFGLWFLVLKIHLNVYV